MQPFERNSEALLDMTQDCNGCEFISKLKQQQQNQKGVPFILFLMSFEKSWTDSYEAWCAVCSVHSSVQSV